MPAPTPYYQPQQTAAAPRARVTARASARSAARPAAAAAAPSPPAYSQQQDLSTGPMPVTRMAQPAGQPANVDDRISYRNMTPPAGQPAAPPQPRPQPQPRSTVRTVGTATSPRAAYAPQYAPPPATAPAPMTRSQNALGGRYIGRSGGAQRYIGADGVTQFTNQDRENALVEREDERDQPLEDRWNRAVDQDGQMVDQAGERMWGDMERTDAAIDGVSDWNPDDLEGWDTSRLRDAQPTNRRAWSPTALDGFDSTETRNVDLSGVQNFQPRNLRGVNTGRLTNYDGGGTMQQYLAETGGGGFDGNVQAGTSGFNAMESVERAARGAAGQAKVTLSDQLEQEANAAARTGRLNTGLFDADKGKVITRVGEDLNNRILGASVDAAGIQAGVENANAGNVTEANIASGRERGNVAALRSGEARDAASLGFQALDAGTGYDVDIADSSDRMTLDAADRYAGHALERGAGIDRNRLTASEATDRMRLDNAGGMDDFELDAAEAWTDAEGRRRTALDSSRYGARRDGADLAVRRQGLSQQLWDSSQDRYGDRIASERDRITGARNALTQGQAQQRQQRADRTNSWIQGGLGVVGALAGG